MLHHRIAFCTSNMLTRNSLAECLVEKWGYESVEAMKKDAMKRFSLLENGILDQPSTRLLLVNVSSTPGSLDRMLTQLNRV